MQGKLIRQTLKALRERADLTQRELCKRLGREHSFVSKYELGERRIDLLEFYRICRACEAQPEKEAGKLMRSFARLDKA